MRAVRSGLPGGSRFLARLLLSAAAVTALLATSAIGSGHAPLAGPYSTSSAGGVQVSFPSAYPEVELSEAGNSSAPSSLSIDQVLEATASASAPKIVAVALPSDIVVTNGTVAPGSSSDLFDLTASLTVYPSNAGLWQGPNNLVQPDGAPIGTAHLAIRYSLSSPSNPSQGATTQWTLTGWPWISANDLLGVQLTLSTPSARGLVACTGGPDSPDTAACTGPALGSMSGLWDPSIRGIQGSEPRGPTAVVDWGTGFDTPRGTAAPVTVGVLALAPSESHLVLAAPAGGSSSVSANVSFALLPPVLSIASPLIVHGESGWYLAGAAASSGATAFAVLAYRHRQRAIEAQL